MTKPSTDPTVDPATVREWQDQGLSLAEIGHRLGISADRLRESLAAQGAETSDGEAGPDDHRPNQVEVR